MNDITKYVSNNKVKPILNYVYLHIDKNGNPTAVATDTFRLAQVGVNLAVLGEIIKLGFYTPEAWKKITKLYNKDDVTVYKEIQIIVEKEMLHQPEEDYPNYENIIPKYEDMERFKGSFLINSDYLCDLIKMFQDKKFKTFDFDKVQENENMIAYFDEDTTVLIMKMKK